jgi:nucleotide-binding universal stress UspA family protein
MTVLVGYIPTAEGRAAVRQALYEARLRQLPLIVVNVHRDAALSDDRLATESELSALQAEAAAVDVAVDVLAPHEGDVSEAILAAARQHHASIIVIGVRHRTPVGKLLLGSTAMEILMNAPCPVVAVRPNAVSEPDRRGTGDDSAERSAT